MIAEIPSIAEVRWIDLPSMRDNRGVLTAIESSENVPFEIKRIFYMHHVIEDRGGHAHVDTDQVVIAISGSFEIEVYDGQFSSKYQMDDPEKGLYIPMMIFVNLYNFSPGAVCLVLSSTHYDIKKSIRNIEDYNKIALTHQAGK